MTDLRYPIGAFTLPGRLSPSDRRSAIQDLGEAPVHLRRAVAGLSARQLDTQYRPGGWTVRQVVHHLPDSHLNSFIRLKRALTEDVPIVRTYDEARFAELPDASGPIEMSLLLLECLHERWVYLWKRLTDEQWRRQLNHPDLGMMGVDELLAFYAWHGRHHVAHITSLRARQHW